MNIKANKKSSEYALFLEHEINYDRSIPFLESDSEDELIEKWKKEPLTYRDQQKVWDYYPNSTLADVIELAHWIDKRFEIKTIEDIYLMNAVPQGRTRERKDTINANYGEIYRKTKEEDIYYYQRKMWQLEKEVEELREKLSKEKCE